MSPLGSALLPSWCGDASGEASPGTSREAGPAGSCDRSRHEGAVSSCCIAAKLTLSDDEPQEAWSLAPQAPECIDPRANAGGARVMAYSTRLVGQLRPAGHPVICSRAPSRQPVSSSLRPPSCPFCHDAKCRGRRCRQQPLPPPPCRGRLHKAQEATARAPELRECAMGMTACPSALARASPAPYGLRSLRVPPSWRNPTPNAPVAEENGAESLQPSRRRDGEARARRRLAAQIGTGCGRKGNYLQPCMAHPPPHTSHTPHAGGGMQRMRVPHRLQL